MHATVPRHDLDLNLTADRISSLVPVPGQHSGHVMMKLPSIFVAPLAVAILSAVLQCGLSGTAASQTATSPTNELPSITVVAPKKMARPHRAEQVVRRQRSVANTVAGRATSPAPQTARTNAQQPAPGSVMARIAALERTSSTCADGCPTSFRYGNQPWNGCSTSGDVILSTTCRNGRNYKTYQECRETGMFLGARQPEVWWYCSSLHAGGKLSGEKLQVAELNRSRRR